MTGSTAVLAGKLDIAWRFFFRRGFVDGFGHISARTVIAASMGGYETLGEAEMAL